jgi:hypothetical protein
MIIGSFVKMYLYNPIWVEIMGTLHDDLLQRRDTVVGTATGYGLDDQGVGVRVQVGSRIFSSSRPTNLLSNGYRGLFPQG